MTQDPKSDVEHEDELNEIYKEVRETLVKLGMDILLLAKEKVRLEAELQLLRDELSREAKLPKESVNLIKKKLILAKQANEIREEVIVERKRTAELQAELDQ